MPDQYFKHFPVIKYGNTHVVDITRRAAILERVSQDPYVFYPYEITHNERADQLASRYYEDSYKSWLIYYANKIVDPYYEWYMHQREFDEFLTKKYTSLENTYNKTFYYRNNWPIAEEIDTAAFEALSPRQINYWTPVYADNGTILSYKRKQTNWSINTNKIVRYTVSNTLFTNNEICNVHFDTTYSGGSQVLFTVNNYVYVQHTIGTTVANTTVTITANSYLYGRESKVNTAFSNSTLIVENISDEEEVYWTPVTYYEHENEKNEFNKTVRLLDNRFAGQTVTELRKIMEE